jgi:predicted outer membrane protein
MKTTLLRWLAAGAVGTGAIAYQAAAFSEPAPSPLPGRPAPGTTDTMTDPSRPSLPTTPMTGTSPGANPMTPHGDPTVPSVTGPDHPVLPQATSSDSANGRLSSKDSREAKRVLSDLHKVNALEVTVGKLAQDKGSTEAIRSYGQQLVDDHQAADQRIMSFAQSHDIALTGQLPSDRSTRSTSSEDRGTRRPSVSATAPGSETATGEPRTTAGTQIAPSTTGTAAPNGMTSDKTASDAPNATAPLDAEGRQLLARLQKLSGSQFDKQFLTAMVQGHNKALAEIKTASGKVENAELRSLLEGVRASVEKHRDHAKELQRAGTS